MIQQLKPFINGVFQESETETYTDVFNPSTGEVIARAPQCTKEEVERAIASAEAAYPAWRDTPAHKRAQLFFRLRHLLMEHLEELTELVARENGKNWKEAEGDVAKAIEMTEIATSIPQLLLGEALMNVSEGYDTTLYREPMGVFAGISPWNFPAMISMGWMAPLCIACGNTMVIKAASPTPMTSNRMAALYKEAGFPDGVLNVITTSRNEAEILLSHPAIRGVSFVGSTEVAKHIYATAASHGKRVQALGEAKNHALVLNDAPIAQTAAAVMKSSFACARDPRRARLTGHGPPGQARGRGPHPRQGLHHAPGRRLRGRLRRRHAGERRRVPAGAPCRAHGVIERRAGLLPRRGREARRLPPGGRRVAVRGATCRRSP